METEVQQESRTKFKGRGRQSRGMNATGTEAISGGGEERTEIRSTTYWLRAAERKRGDPGAGDEAAG
eukprot:751349-Hanusia_phi.AAC.1